MHRDLKPENIFLSTNGGLTDYPKVLDFGLAKVTERELRPGSMMLTQEGMVFGTPEFMSPEQAQGKVLDARSDIYSLAVILYEVLTGKLPFEAQTPMEYIQHHVTRSPIPLDDRVPGSSFRRGSARCSARRSRRRPEESLRVGRGVRARAQAVRGRRGQGLHGDDAEEGERGAQASVEAARAALQANKSSTPSAFKSLAKTVKMVQQPPAPSAKPAPAPAPLAKQPKAPAKGRRGRCSSSASRRAA